VELWQHGQVDRSGCEEPRPFDLRGTQTRAWFTPGHGRELSHRIAKAIGRSRRRVRIASPVITTGPVVGTLAQVAADGDVDLRGVVDRPQMEQVFRQWHENPRSGWKIPILASVFEHADFSGKPSTPYGPDTPHDFMHAKVTVADDDVFIGSFNLSRSGEQNAENVLELRDPELAERLASFVDSVRERYRAMAAP
jgi:phosphatidylserine/phosphatidylglycerophosphate/cardiolipin synthase-like enzyme